MKRWAALPLLVACRAPDAPQAPSPSVDVAVRRVDAGVSDARVSATDAEPEDAGAPNTACVSIEETVEETKRVQAELRKAVPGKWEVEIQDIHIVAFPRVPVSADPQTRARVFDAVHAAIPGLLLGNESTYKGAIVEHCRPLLYDRAVDVQSIYRACIYEFGPGTPHTVGDVRIVRTPRIEAFAGVVRYGEREVLAIATPLAREALKPATPDFDRPRLWLDCGPEGRPGRAKWRIEARVDDQNDYRTFSVEIDARTGRTLTADK